VHRSRWNFDLDRPCFFQRGHRDNGIERILDRASDNGRIRIE
jgi:hypothetical protein